MKPTLIVMVKEPRLGRVKTRLGLDLGLVTATWWYRHQVSATLRRLTDPRWEIVLAVTPDHSSWPWPSQYRQIPQGRGDLGARMARALRAVHPGPAFLIGSDIPGVERQHISTAFARLGSFSSAIGPASDGGYWGIGLRHPGAQPAGFLTNVRWSTDMALTDTLASVPSLRWATLDTLSDVDRGDDFARLRRAM